MQELDSITSKVEQLLHTREGYRLKAIESLNKIYELNEYLKSSTEAQQILISVSDQRTEDLLRYITGVLNNALAEIFPNSEKTISLNKTLYRDKHPHINVVVRDKDGDSVDLSLAMGAGVGVVVSMLYRICLIEVKGDRKLILADEILHGIHPSAVVVLVEILKLFAKEGFQFILVEYVLNGIDFGKNYYVINRGGEATVIDSYETYLHYLHDVKALKPGTKDYANYTKLQGTAVTEDTVEEAQGTASTEDDDIFEAENETYPVDDTIYS